MLTDARDSATALGDPDVQLLRDVATAVVHLSRVRQLTSFALPYPRQAQRALDAVVLACLRQGARPPSGVPGLLEWCRARPVSNWPLEGLAELGGLADLARTGEDLLIDVAAQAPSQLCHELALEGGSRSSAQQVSGAVVRRAMRLCRDAYLPESYTAFRRLLVEQPVLTRAALTSTLADLYLDPVRELIDLVYVPVPDNYVRDGAYTPCARCRTLLTPLADGGWWCEHARCRFAGAPAPGTPLVRAATGEVRHLEQPLRLFVTGPGRAEIALEERLTQLGLTVDMWPGFDAYDLRVTFPDGRVWAVDVKDWVHAGFLGRSANPVRGEPPYDEACWAVPAFRVEQRRDYLQVYERESADRPGRPPLLTDDHVVRAASARLRGVQGPRARISPSPGPAGDGEGDSRA
ncbi:hypothetical protein [Streptomyces cremeus]|uniref:REase associating with pPIWI RE domain-containing protein n=1 Tax=Streptomyces cremeus TaxID=66881 RepID=A0ABV5P5D1_STRCM